MGYHVTILRTKGAQTPLPLTRDEVVGVVTAFPEWRYEPSGNALVLGEDDEAAALWFSDGTLWAKNPDDAVLRAMLKIANHLGARVRGDELETYRTVDESYLHPDDVEEKRRGVAQSFDWRRYASYAPPALGVLFLVYAAVRSLIKYVG